ncbi:unnamed protein product [Rotaria sordida]|uniref:RanBP2-type domain-containing protein n=1 Tax=Rotaria sordida TaxID=392033 RepID=A0A815EEG0_9BILA|nr:unnamed protein product [Rotaria sordida]CAF4046620.1 unnamed protein product [Rotaria sordida]
MELAYLMSFQRVLVSFCPNPPTADNRLSYVDYDDQRDLASKLFQWQWQCPRCTFLNNDSFRICEMCSYEKGS